MICPLLAIATPGDLKQAYRSLIGCFKEECAWWQSDLQNCIIYQAGMELGTLCLILEEIKNTMPCEPDFRR